MILIIGGSAGGKSEYAEQRMLAFPGARVYLATMEDPSPEGRDRIAKHRAHRAGRGFRTVECPRNLGSIAVGKEENVLLECLSNLAANEMFLPDGTVRTPEETARITAEEVLSLALRCRELIVVGNILTEAGTDYAGLTADWLRAFSAAQNRIAAEAEEVRKVTCGIPELLYRKNGPGGAGWI